MVTVIYAALLGLGFVLLSLRVIHLRRRFRVALGSGGQVLLRRAIRAQANFAEYVPLALLLLAFLESQGAPLMLVHGLGIALLAGRLLHARGLTQEPEPLRLRVYGMLLTLAVVTGASIALLLLKLQPLLA